MAKPVFDASPGGSCSLSSPRMKVLPTRLDGLRLLAPHVHGDERGFFHEAWRAAAYAGAGVAAARDSPTFGQWEGFELDDRRAHQLFLPIGFGHGFCVLSESADVVYKVSSYYDPGTERGIRFDDPRVGVRWPMDLELVFSERDATAPELSEVAGELPFAYVPG